MKPYITAPKRVWVVLGFLLLAALVGSVIAQETVSSSAVPLPTAPSPTVEPLATPSGMMPFGPNMPHREISGAGKSPDGKSPAISFIDSPSATCSSPVPGTAACYIQWDYLYVTAASSSYIVSMTVTIDSHIRAYHAGFFQTSMYIPSGMTAPGYKVTCGTPGSGGTANWGHTYSYVIRARETSGLSSANYGSVLCPAADEHMLTVSTNGTGSGSVISVPDGIDCGLDCSEIYIYGTDVTLTAVANTGSTFTGWSGVCNGTNDCVVMMSESKNVTATFTKYYIFLPVVISDH